MLNISPAAGADFQLPELPPVPSGPNPTSPSAFGNLYDRLMTSPEPASRPLPTSMEVPALIPPSASLSEPFKPSAEFPGAVSPDASGGRPSSPYAFLQPLVDGAKQVSALQNDAARLGNEAAIGGDVDLHDVMIATEKASTAVQLAVQIRNKIVDAYQEIDRMQV